MFQRWVKKKAWRRAVWRMTFDVGLLLLFLLMRCQLSQRWTCHPPHLPATSCSATDLKHVREKNDAPWFCCLSSARVKDCFVWVLFAEEKGDCRLDWKGAPFFCHQERLFHLQRKRRYVRNSRCKLQCSCNTRKVSQDFILDWRKQDGILHFCYTTKYIKPGHSVGCSHFFLSTSRKKGNGRANIQANVYLYAW